MAKKTIQGSKELAKQIKLRRNELGLTIEEAASRTNVGTKTWSRYEAGSSIRIDTCKGICKALNSYTIPNQIIEDNEQFSIQEYKNHEPWSEFLYQMKCTLLEMRMYANSGSSIIAHTVLEELLLYLCCMESSTLIEFNSNLNKLQDIDWKDWIYDLFDDMDIISFLYSDIYLGTNHPYHFFQWTKKQFYTNEFSDEKNL